MRCLIDGHTPISRDGVGEFSGNRFSVCAVCGITLAVEHTGYHEPIQRYEHPDEQTMRRLWMGSL